MSEDLKKAQDQVNHIQQVYQNNIQNSDNSLASIVLDKSESDSSDNNQNQDNAKQKKVERDIFGMPVKDHQGSLRNQQQNNSKIHQINQDHNGINVQTTNYQLTDSSYDSYQHTSTPNEQTKPLINNQEEVQIQHFKVNMQYLLKITLVLMLAGVQIGYILSCMQPIDLALGLKFEYTQDNGQALSSLLSCSGVFGMAIGSYLLVIPIMKRWGRRRAILIGVYIGVVGILAQMVESYAMILIGRFIYGLACGIHVISVTRFIEETVPYEKINLFLPLYFCATSSARIIVMILASGMPSDDDIDANLHSSYWRFILAYPLFLYALLFCGVKLIIHHDSVKYLILTDQQGEALKAISKIYAHSENDRQILMYLQKTIYKDTLKITYKNTFTHPNYKWGTLILVLFAILHESTGNSAVNMLCRNLFRQIQKTQETALTLNSSNWLIAFLALGASFASVYVTYKYGRKIILVCGYSVLALFLFIIGISVATKQNDMAYVLIIIYIMIYQLLNGSIIWLYLVETCPSDNAFGLVSMIIWFSLIVVTFISPPMIKNMGSVLFFGYCLVGVITAVFCGKIIKETKGLTDKQKKQLYVHESMDDHDVMSEAQNFSRFN
eukprot:403371420